MSSRQVVDQPECAGTMMAKKLFFRPFVFNTPYHLVFRYWYRNFVTVFAPFFILSYLNFRIVKAFTHLPKMSIVDLSACDMARRKANARAATRTLVLVACCYLVSNIINVVVTTFEHTNKEHLTENYPRLYMLAIDLVSLLTTMACACRLPIYMSCQKALRQEVLQVFRRIIPGRNSYLEEQTQETMLPMSKSFESETPTPLASPAPDPTAASEEEEEDRIYWMSPPPKSVGSPYETLL
ncbi:unnamed protein product [Caenorhabditis auriculariae]|uniref:G-protein coupled receptors family 1 profile domain-containing protein n=1 Tax=Caenorhabditis auriculariae TaxID=2777116 RepID=A0A8S1HGV3_9PELO|nr:unnamed protein product [Caenorhabditis auriculariae]